MNGPAIEKKMGKIFDLQHFCLDDGPGIRTTVFLKGCPLRCIWCHNPESYEKRDTISYNESKCSGCGACAEVCPQKAHRIVTGMHRFEREACTRCGACTEVCCYGALEKIGRTVTAEEVIAEVKKDRTFYEKPGPGGITISGGEPLFQPYFLRELLQAARDEGIHTCLETSGFCAAEPLNAVIPLTDLFLFDLKGERAAYPNLTGVRAEEIYRNLDILLEKECHVVIRVPLIPGINDTETFFGELAKLYRRQPGIEAFEIMPYHGMGASKAVQAAVVQGLGKQPDATEDEKKAWLAALKGLGLPAFINYFKNK